MASKKPKKTPKPTGLGITRNINTFTMSWKAAAKNHNGGQILYTKNSASKWKKVSIANATRSITWTLNKADYYPYKASGKNKPKVTSISFKISGKQKKSGKKVKTLAMSDESSKSLTILPPKTPSISCTRTTRNSSTVSWSTEVSDTDARWFTNVLLQTVLVKNKNVHGKNVTGWTDVGSYSRNYSYTREENTTLIYQSDNASYVRWYRVKARGPAGDSAWSYAYCIFTKPNKATLNKITATKDKAAFNTIQAYAKFTTQLTTYYKPIDYATVQYCITEPDLNFTLPDGTQWTDGPSIVDAAHRNTNSTTFVIDTPLTENKCVFIRVNNYFGDQVTEGNSYAAIDGITYTLTQPTITNLVPDDSTYRISLTASNPSAQNVPDSKLAVIFRTPDSKEDKIVAVLTGANPSAIIRCPNWSNTNGYAIGVYAFADKKAITSAEHTEPGKDGTTITYTVYNVPENPIMKSEEEWSSGEIPKAPTGLQLSSPKAETIQVSWEWDWQSANIAELSWSDHDDAWESTDEPTSYRIENIHAAKWNISGLEAGIEWYIRVRLIKSTEESEVLGPWSEIMPYRLTYAPDIPNLTLSSYVIPKGTEFTARWEYISNDGTDQNAVQMCLAHVDEEGIITYDNDFILDEETFEKEHTFNPDDLGWETGNSYYICVRVKSESERLSGWSQYQVLNIADPLTIDITETSLESRVITPEEEDEEPLTRYYLTATPLTLTVVGAGTTAYTTVTIRRKNSYHASRPDESEYDGFADEVVAYISQQGEAPIVIDNDNLIGILDDTAEYILTAMVYDDLGQSVSSEIPFIVDWSHQAIMPDATIEIDNENYIAKITPIKPEGWAEGDVCDIYRLSADKPELIIQGGEFGTTYVDPYPAIGEFGGHRVVFRTKNNDYITADGTYAWVDFDIEDGDIFETPNSIIDTPDIQIKFLYNINLSNSWKKDFQETQYLGGNVQGDWNPAVSRTGTVDTVSVIAQDQDTIKDFRRLAAYPGICHIRTSDGSSYAADIQVSENLSYDSYQLVSYNLSITRVDSQQLDGMTLAEWQERHGE